MSGFELALSEEDNTEILSEMNCLMRNFQENYLMTARDYADAGCYEEAIAILEQCTKAYPLLSYYKGYYYAKLGNTEKCISEYKEADACNPIYCFPNKLEDIAVLKEAIRVLPKRCKSLLLSRQSLL